MDGAAVPNWLTLAGARHGVAEDTAPQEARARDPHESIASSNLLENRQRF